ncbi:hypothetical protein LTS18_004448 [Coniosporium uncinatum]|uniref:Uncharacterized protein n=1 Tax=Coniosporium uncinatum TaxID=93489 RepID=A0ACC3DY67_9PEZI|nr:hypothetical protein LTS18_004448 [Coniosporium uncinatum]
MVAASMLSAPPSSASHPSRKPVVNHTASTAAVLATLPSLPSQPVKDPQVLSQSQSTPIANATLTTNSISLPRTTATKLAAAAVAAGSTPPRTIAELKIDLRIIDWRCGAQTATNTECQRYILKGSKQLIDLQLTSMTDLTRASPDFEPTLLKLVVLVHCYQHVGGPPKERRLEAWRLAFLPGSADGSEPEAPVEQLMRKALGMLSTECIARGNGWTCERRVGGQKVQNCERTLQELVKQDIYSSDVKLELLLKVLEWNRTCSDHESSRQFTSVAAWKKSVMAVLPAPKPVVNRAIANNAPNEPQMPPRAQASPPIVTSPTTEKKDLVIVQIHPLPSPRASSDLTTNLNTDPASYWPKAYDTSLFEILVHADRLASPTLSHKLIRTKISRLLDARDLHDGYVYAYEVDGNNGYVKIGYTTRSVTDRHDEWSFDCNRQTKLLYPSPPPPPPPPAPPPLAAAAANILIVAAAVTTTAARPAAAAMAVLTPHARRIEALCHAELDHRRIRTYCGACLKQHVEWFDVSAAEVTAVIQKWSRWMATRPYERLQLRCGSMWALKASEVQRTMRIEQSLRRSLLL